MKNGELRVDTKDGSVVMAKDIEMVRKQASKDDFTCMCAPL